MGSREEVGGRWCVCRVSPPEEVGPKSGSGLFSQAAAHRRVSFPGGLFPGQRVVPPACSCLHTFSITRAHLAVRVPSNVFYPVISYPEAAWWDVCSHPRLRQVPASRTREPGLSGHRPDQEPLSCS